MIEQKIYKISTEMCIICLEMGRPNTIDKSLIGEYGTRDDLLNLLSNNLEILRELVKQNDKKKGCSCQS